MKHLSFFIALASCIFVRCDSSPPITIVYVEDGGTSPEAGLSSVTISPRPLIPPFSSSIHDYYIRCNAGTNPITITTADASGSQTLSLDVTEDQAIVVQDEYWIRCLPQDFPAITVNHPSSGATPGYYLVNDAAYAIVFDTNGVPVWYARGPSVNFIDSTSVNQITTMLNATPSSFGTNSSAEFEIFALDSQQVTIVQAASGAPTDTHELRTLPNGHHLLFTYPIETGVDLSGLSNFSSAENVADCEIEEVDASNDLVWSWLASDHVDAVSESLFPNSVTVNGETVRDVFHCNAIDVDSSGNLLVSMRHACALFYVDKSTGKVLWKVGGAAANKDGATYISVENDPQGPFNLQHDARFEANGDISLYDDHGAISNSGVARGVEYAIDHTQNTASLVWEFLGTEEAQYEGSFRRYSDGENVIGWGEVAPDARVATEVDANGNDVFEISLSPNVATYRAVKVPISQLDIGLLRATTAVW